MSIGTGELKNIIVNRIRLIIEHCQTYISRAKFRSLKQKEQAIINRYFSDRIYLSFLFIANKTNQKGENTTNNSQPISQRIIRGIHFLK